MPHEMEEKGKHKEKHLHFFKSLQQKKVGGVFGTNSMKGQVVHKSNEGVAIKCHIFVTHMVDGG